MVETLGHTIGPVVNYPLDPCEDDELGTLDAGRIGDVERTVGEVLGQPVPHCPVQAVALRVERVEAGVILVAVVPTVLMASRSAIITQ